MKKQGEPSNWGIKGCNSIARFEPLNRLWGSWDKGETGFPSIRF